MKTTFKDLFLEFDDDLIDIPENTVYEETNIRKELIKKNTLSKAGCQKKKLTFRKVVKLTMIAASIAVIIGIFSTVIYAKSDIQIAVEEFFGGSMNSAGLYDGGDVSIISGDPNLNVEFLGVTGDEYEVFAVIKTTKKDGSTFTDEGYMNPDITTDYKKISDYRKSIDGGSGLTPDKYLSEIATFYGLQAVCKDRYGNNVGYRDNGNATIDTRYYLSEDRKTLKLLMWLNIPRTKNIDLRDGTATIKSSSFIARKNIKTILISDHIDGDVEESFRKKCEEMNINPLECDRLCTDDEVIYCLSDGREYPLPFEITFKMNYRYNGNIKKDLNYSDAPHLIKKDTNNVKMTITPFSINISGESQNVNSNLCFEPVRNSKIIMKDGTSYILEYHGGAGCGGPAAEKIEQEMKFVYREKPIRTLEMEKTLIDTRQIKQIIINGDIIYEA